MLSTLIRMRRAPKRPYNKSRIHVQSSLSVTPAEMMYNAEHGIPIASQLVDESQFYDGDTGRQVTLPNWYCRGYDIVDAWNDQHESRSKVRNLKTKSSSHAESPAT